MTREWLLVDLGNSRLKWSRPSRLPGLEGVSWRGRPLEAVLDHCWGRLPRPAGVAVAEVAGAAARQALERWMMRHWGLEPCFVDARRGWKGLECGYDDPGQLGADRWAALVAAHVAWPQGCLVVDCGTATTLDAVAGGRHLGGYILPGIQAMFDALGSSTTLSLPPPGNPGAGNWGRNTAACIRRGIAGSLVALVESSLERLQAEGVCDPTLVLTGGHAGSIGPLIQVDYRRRDALVLEGVLLCCRRETE